MFKAYIKQTLDEVKDNKVPGEKLEGNLEEQTVDEEKGNKPPGEKIEGYGDFEEKNNNKCDIDSYFPYNSDNSIDAGDSEKKPNMGGNKKNSMRN